jgi:type IV pilus assembly protein PilE
MHLSARATKQASGFTLIELMITVAVIGILAGIAFPSYRSYVVRNNRAAAQAVLMEIAQRQTQYLLDSRSYASTVSILGVAVPAKVASVYKVDIVNFTAGPPPTFTASAAPISGTAQANDGTLSIDQTGVKSPADKW